MVYCSVSLIADLYPPTAHSRSLVLLSLVSYTQVYLIPLRALRGSACKYSPARHPVDAPNTSSMMVAGVFVARHFPSCPNFSVPASLQFTSSMTSKRSDAPPIYGNYHGYVCILCSLKTSHMRAGITPNGHSSRTSDWAFSPKICLPTSVCLTWDATKAWLRAR